MKMRQSLADWEQAFVKEISLDRRRRDSLRRTTEQRKAEGAALVDPLGLTFARALLVLTLVLTAVIVTVVMFRTLYLLLG
jgi:hypothetical protein